METKIYRINCEDEMKIPARDLAKILKMGDVVALRGTLGAGKTAFSRALIAHLAGERTEVPSPTFTLVQTYDLPHISIWHFDLYRMEEKEADILELGWEEARRYGVALVEWAERLGNLLPKAHIEVKIDFVEGDTSHNLRDVTISQL